MAGLLEALSGLLGGPPGGGGLLGDQLIEPPRNPARMPQGVEDFAKGMTIDPFADAISALRGRMTPEEAKSFALSAAMSLVSPMARGARPYQSAPDSLMGFRRMGQNVPFEESRYPFTQNVEVKLPNGEKFTDAIKGLNKSHALERARRNWDGSEIKAID